MRWRYEPALRAFRLNMGAPGKIVAAKAKPAKAPVVRAPAPPQRALMRETIQPVLKVGPANDPYEKEAEAMADRVVAMPEPAPDLPAATPRPAASSAQRMEQGDQPNTDTFETAPDIPADHQDPEVSVGEDVDTAGIDKGEFDEIESGSPDPPDGDIVAPERSGALAAVGPEGGAAPADVARIVAQPGAGRPLPTAVRGFMEPRFGYDFSDVRIHDGPGDRQAAARIGARAFTHGSHIWMGGGESVENRRLIAHELTHVIQQTERAPSRPMRMEADDETVQRGYIAEKAEGYARNVPGYTLLTVILGRSPITGNRVTRNAENLVGGFLGLLPGGEQIFQKLKESRALENAFTWVSTRLSELKITWSRIKSLIGDFVDEMTPWPGSPVAKAKRIFGPLVRDIITFVKEIKDKILEFVVRGALKLAGPFGEKVWGVIEKARDTISMILNDPLGFAKNLVGAVVKGFKQFGARIWEHIKSGLMGWLMGSMQGTDIKMPAKLDFKGLLSIGLQVLGLTYDKFRAMLVKRLGANGEKKVAFLEKSVEVVKILVKEGFLGIWQRLLQMLEGFKETVIGGIRDFVINTLVMGAIGWVAGLSNPVGAIVKVALSIYNMVVAFLERIDQIAELANAIFSSIGAIAKGQVKQAADFIEKTIAATIPVVLAFVAALIPVNGITKAIKDIIRKLQKSVEKALKKMIAFLVKKAKKLFSKLLGKLNSKRKLPGYKFDVGKTEHSFYPKQVGKKVKLFFRSTETESNKVQEQMKIEAKRAEEFGSDPVAGTLFFRAFRGEVDDAEKEVAKLDLKSTTKSQQKPAARAGAETNEAAQQLDQGGEQLDGNPFFDTKPKDGTLLRAREPRLEKIEGKVDTYYQLGKLTSQPISAHVEGGGSTRLSKKTSSFYENDHIPEQALMKALKEAAQNPPGALKQAAKGMRDGAAAAEKKGEKPTADQAFFARIEDIGDSEARQTAITVYRPVHRNKSKKDAGKRDHQGKISKNTKGSADIAAYATGLRKTIKDEIDSEVEHTIQEYNADEGATKTIRQNVSAGLKSLYAKANENFGTDITSAAPTKLDTDKDGAGTTLPLTGDAEKGHPDFTQIEGQKFAYSATKSLKVGNFIEFDHIPEKQMAARLRDWTFSDFLDAAKLKEAAEAARPMNEDGTPPSPGQKGAMTKRENKLIDANLAPATYTGGIAAYDGDAAETVGLYRPVHREVTAKMPTGAKMEEALKTRLDGGALTAEAAPLIARALYPKPPAAAGPEILREIRTRIRNQLKKNLFEQADDHSLHIAAEYKGELNEVAAINQDKQAVAAMTKIVGNVGGTTRDLRNHWKSQITNAE